MLEKFIKDGRKQQNTNKGYKRKFAGQKVKNQT
jgi:hypothetical protein